MNEDLSFYLSFAGFSFGVLALICTLVLLFGRSGTRKILGWTFSLLILGTIVTVGIIWANGQREANLAEQATKWKAEQARTFSTWTKEEADDYYRRNGRR